jgi:hypothetical protein
LPSSVYEVLPKGPQTDDPERRDEFLFGVIPRNTRQVYKMRPIVEAVVDKDSFFEMGRMFGRGMITGLARIDGVPVAVMASDPFFYAGAWTADVCDKIIRFVDLAETFHLPVVYLCDCPGFQIGLEAEKAATIRKGVRAMAAVNQTTVPWCTFLVRNVFGVGRAVFDPLCLALGALGIAAAGGRDRGCLPRRDRRRARPRPKDRRDRRAAAKAALAVPHRGDVLGRGDHRSARHPPSRGRFRPPRRQVAPAGREQVLHAALGPSLRGA